MLLTCYYFTPFHIIVIWIIKECSVYIQIDDVLLLNILGFAILILIAFMFLVFIEIIEVNIFNISYNTKRNIEIRSKIDSLFDINNILAQDEEIKEEEEKSDLSNLTTFN